MSMPADQAETVTVTLPREALDYLYAQARQRGILPVDVLVSALGTDKFVREKANSATSNVVVVEGGKSEKLVFPK